MKYFLAVALLVGVVGCGEDKPAEPKKHHVVPAINTPNNTTPLAQPNPKNKAKPIVVNP